MDERIEIRSERMQHIVGEMPNYLFRYGVLVALFVSGVLLSVCNFVRYPSTLVMQGQLSGNNTINLFLFKPDWAEEIKSGIPIEIESGGMTIWRTEIISTDTVEHRNDDSVMMEIRVLQMSDTIRIGSSVYLFTEGSPLTIKIKGKPKSLLQHMITNV